MKNFKAVQLAGVPPQFHRHLVTDFYFQKTTRAITVSPKNMTALQLAKELHWYLGHLPYFIVFEKAPTTGRIHAHGLVKLHTCHINTLRDSLRNAVGSTVINLDAGPAWYEYMFKDYKDTWMIPYQTNKQKFDSFTGFDNPFEFGYVKKPLDLPGEPLNIGFQPEYVKIPPSQECEVRPPGPLTELMTARGADVEDTNGVRPADIPIPHDNLTREPLKFPLYHDNMNYSIDTFIDNY